MDARERDCRAFEELANAARDDAATPDEREALAAHLARCERCRARAEGFARVDVALAADAPAAPPALLARVDTLVLDAAAPSAATRTSPLRRVAAIAAAAALVAAALALLGPREGTGSGGDALPLRAIAELQRRSLDDQALLMETMRWELRALRLEVHALRERDADGAPVLARIDRLLARTEGPPWSHPDHSSTPKGDDR